MTSSWLNDFELEQDERENERIQDILTYPVLVTEHTPPYILKLLLDAAIARQYKPKPKS